MFSCFKNHIINYLEQHPEDNVRLKILVINLLEFFVKQTTNTLDDEAVRIIKIHLFQSAST